MKTDKQQYYKEGKELSPQRELAIRIIEEFEELLEAHNLTISNRDREGNPEEARIYGLNYYVLEDKLTELIEKWIKKNYQLRLI